MVLAFHVGLFWQRALWRGWSTLLAEQGVVGYMALLVARVGFLGVDAFLVISGFCLFHPVARGGRNREPYGSFLAARALRMFPPYLVSMALIVALKARAGWFSNISFFPIELRDVGAHVLMLHNLDGETIWSINGAYWSLALEWQLYLVFPLLAWLLTKRGVSALLVGSGLVTLGWHWAMKTWASPESLVEGGWAVVFEALPEHLFEFCCGMAAASVVAAGKVVPRRTLMVVSMVWFPVAWFQYVGPGTAWPVEKFACGGSFAALLVLAARTSVLPAWLKPLRFVGLVSFSLYLVHEPLLLVTRFDVGALSLGPGSLWLLTGVGLLPVLVAGSWIFHRAFEAPFLRGSSLRLWLDPRLTRR